MNVLLVTNNNKDTDFSFSKEVIEYLRSKDITLYSDDEELINQFNLHKMNNDKIDFSIIIGGDGTVLKYASKYGKADFPFVGINFGRVGALAAIEKENYRTYLDKVIDKDYYIEERMGLDCIVSFKDSDKVIKFTGYNDIILHRGLSMKLLPIITKINDSKEDVIFADGVVVATPNGSSAYNVSAGGPLLSPSSKCYVITPICPQSRIFTSLVVSDDDVVSLSISNKSSLNENEITISGDGFYNSFVSPGDKIVIKKADKGLKMIKFNESDSLYQAAHKALNSMKKKGEK